MRALNREFLKHDYATDVLCFPYDESVCLPTEERLVGEVYVCPETVVSQAAELGIPSGQELLRVIIHGLLHLAGYDDLDTSNQRLMKRKQEQLLREHEAFVTSLQPASAGLPRKKSRGS
jgi:rRNA maturation RNase YbeY